MEQVPEGQAPPKLQGSIVESGGSLPPAEFKRITHPTPKRQPKKSSNQTRE
jgi:hypothetical protein